MTPDDLHYLITRLNGVSGELMNCADGVTAMTPEKAGRLEGYVGEVVDRIRRIYETAPGASGEKLP